MARILLIDDQPELLLAMRKALTSASHQVTAVGDGQYVLDGSTGVDFDLVITDMIMPGADSAQTLAYLRGRNPRMSVIAISGGGRLAPSFHLKLASGLGALVTLEKPFSLGSLVETVARVLEQKQLTESSDHALPAPPRLRASCGCS